MPLLEIKNLQLDFVTHAGRARAVDGVSLTLAAGETVCLVGESGCGKSVTAQSIARLVPTPPAEYIGGEILLHGRDVLKMSAPELCAIRGGVVSYVFQEPGAALNPVFRIGAQIKEALKLHRPLTPSDGKRNPRNDHSRIEPLSPVGTRSTASQTITGNDGDAVERVPTKFADKFTEKEGVRGSYDDEVIRLLKLVGIPAPEARAKNYPFELSGGMQQRVMIAMALASEPQLLVADEPTTALDVTIQAQILDLLRDLKQRLGMAILLITHNLGLVGEIADRVAVMYAGQIVELAPARALLQRPLHPYTRALMASVPKLQGGAERLTAIAGNVPRIGNFPTGCRFAPRCAMAKPECAQNVPELIEVEPGRWVRCPFWR
jgi:oligopeptide/dipeptide ABC transporter ATP-binding protein